MPYINRPIPENELARATMGDELPATLGQTLSATFGNPTLRPTQMAVDRIEREGLRPTESMTPGQRMATLAIRKLSDALGFGGDDEPVVQPAKLNDQYRDLGISFDRPVIQSYADSIAKGKREELIRNDVIARGPTGLTAGSLKFGASFVGAAIDPINVASAFVPVVGEARYAGLVAKFGTTQARLVRGVAEGAIGNAAIEPLNYRLASQAQLDYSLADSAVNIALGGLLGGGLHVVGGRVGDYLQARRPHEREQALRASVAQMVEGKTPDVESVFTTGDRAAAMRIAMGIDSETVGSPTIDLLQRSPARDAVSALKRDLMPQMRDKLPREDARQLQSTIETIQAERQQLLEAPLAPLKRDLKQQAQFVADRVRGRDVERRARELRTQQIAEVDQRLAVAQSRMTQHQAAAAAQSAVSRIETRERQGVSYADIYSEARRHLPSLPELRSVHPPQALTISDLRSKFARVAKAEANPRRDITADYEASERVSQAAQRAGDARGEADYEAEGIAQLRASGALSRADEKELALLDSFANRADAYARAAQVAARCVAR